MSAEAISQQAAVTLRNAQTEANSLVAQNRPREAKVVLTTAQRDLRDLKRDLADEQRDIRDRATDRRSQVNNAGQIVGLLGNSHTRSNLARGRAMANRQGAADRTAALRPYDAVKADIDRMLADLDRAKARLADAGASTTAAPSPALARRPPHSLRPLRQRRGPLRSRHWRPHRCRHRCSHLHRHPVLRGHSRPFRRYSPRAMAGSSSWSPLLCASNVTGDLRE